MKLVATLAAAFVGAAMGQVETIGVPMGRMLKLTPRVAMMMAEVDVDSAIRDDVNRTKDQEGGMPFGLNVRTNFNAEDAGNWNQVSYNTWAWRLKIPSFGAKALLPVFEYWSMPKGGSLFA
jgi:hypothetical protein